MKKSVLTFIILAVSFSLRAQTTYYWKGAAGSSAAPANWTTATNWNTLADGAGTNRLIPAITDTLVFDGAVMGVNEYYLGLVPKETINTLRVINNAKITFTTAAVSELIPDAITSADYGGSNLSVTGTTGSFTALKVGDVLTTVAGFVNPMPYAEVLAIKDGNNITVSKENGSAAFASQPQYYVVPALRTTTLTVSAGSFLQFGAGNTFFPFALITAGGTVAGTLNFNSRGGGCKLICTTRNAGSPVAGLHFTAGSAVNINTSTSGKWNYMFGSTIGEYVGGVFIYNNGTGENNVMPGYTGAAGVVFESGSSFTMGAGEHYTPLGTSVYATAPLVYTPAVAFNPGSNYILNSNRIALPQFFGNSNNVTYPNLDFKAGFPTNLTLGRVENLSVSGTTAAAVSTGTVLVTGNVSNTSPNAINFGSVILAGTAAQSINGTGAISFNTLTIADKAVTTLLANATATNVNLLGKLNFGAFTITGPGSGTFATYGTFTKNTMSGFTMGAATFGGINSNNNFATATPGNFAFDYPVGTSIASTTYVPDGTIYRSYTGAGNGVMSKYAVATVANPPGNVVVFSNTGSVFTTSNAGGITASAPGFSMYALDVNGPTSLPVTLISFKGVLDNAKAKLSWTTTSELNTSAFQVEKNTGSGFTKIARVKATNQAGLHTYSFTDPENLTTANTYYRLKLIDADGRFTYSNIAVVKLLGTRSNTLSLSLYPNPVLSGINIMHTAALAGSKVIVYNAAGQAVLSKNISTGSAFTQINLAAFTAGMYTIVFSNNNEIVKTSFIKN